jgi:acyl-CoA thioester hydrolase
MNYKLPLQLRWADIDANFHVRHSVYYDWAALCLTESVYHQFNMGPILFREECRFRREIRMGDSIAIDLELVNARRDFSRWTIQHSIWKSSSVEAARLTVEGAFIDLHLRKLAIPPSLAQVVFEQMPRSSNFQWSDTANS